MDFLLDRDWNQPVRYPALRLKYWIRALLPTYSAVLP